MTYCYNCMSKVNDGGKCEICGFTQDYYEIQPHQLMPGYKLRDRYVVGKVLGEGGFGITYIGVDEFFDEKVAIKEFYMTGFVNRNNTYSARVSAETGDKGELFERNREKFYDEAKVLVKLGKEDGIVKVRDFFYENETAYIVMDYLEGKTLKDLLKERKTLTVDETLQMVEPILTALSKVHAQDIIHRDISPDNIIITEDGKPWLIDFGAAREFAEDDIKSLSVILKPGYAPEEQYRRRGVQGPWTDIYAICATMYRCISGKRPDDVLERIMEDETDDLCKIAPSCPKRLSDVIMKGLSVRQKDRYQSIEELKVDLEKAITEPLEVTEETELIPVVETPVVQEEVTYEATEMVFPNAVHSAIQVEKLEAEIEYETAPAEEEPMFEPESELIYEPESEPIFESEPEVVEIGEDVSDEQTEMVFPTERSVTFKSTLKTEEKPTADLKYTTEEKPAEKISNKENSEEDNNRKKKKKTWLIPVAILGVGILVAVFFIFFFTKPATSKNEDVKTASVGDTVFFGSYEQDGSTANGTEPIEWEILSKENGKALLISKYVLDCQPYNTESVDVTWETCSLRKWLNSDFLNSAFDKTEKSQIPEVELDNLDNPYHGTKGGNSTKDRVFALSVDEITKYYSFDYWNTEYKYGYSDDLIIEATPYAESEGVCVHTFTKDDYNEDFSDVYKSDVIGSRGAAWWLRSPGYGSDYACFVLLSGGAGAYPNYSVDADNGGVRPALYVAY